MPERGAYTYLKRLLLGRPIPTHLAQHERLSRVTGLAVLSSDALSSVAYATEEILRVLVAGGLAALTFATPIGLLIATLLGIVAFSYRQTIAAYPGGGGAYIVSKDNLGEMPALVAAAALLIDYTLDRRGQRGRGRRRPHVGVSGVAHQPRRALAALSGHPRDRKPQRHTRIGADLRGAHLLLHRHDPAAHRGGGLALRDGNTGPGSSRTTHCRLAA